MILFTLYSSLHTTQEVPRALTAAIVILLALMLIGGYYVEHAQPWITWLSVLSHLRWGYEGGIVAAFLDVSYAQQATVYTALDAFPEPVTESDILSSLGLRIHSLGYIWLILLLAGAVWRLLAFCCMQRTYKLRDK